MSLLSPESYVFDSEFVFREYYVYRKCGYTSILVHVCMCVLIYHVTL